MTRVHPVTKPLTFDAKCNIPGDQWLILHPDAKRPRDYWSPFRNDLENGFNGRCGYAAMHLPTGGTVDHFISFKNDKTRSYDWGNYRFASGLLNSIKRTKDAQVLDPYHIQNGWFEIILPSLQMQVSSAVPAADKADAESTLKLLKLRDDERIIRWRQSWFDMYERSGMSQRADVSG